MIVLERSVFFKYCFQYIFYSVAEIYYDIVENRKYNFKLFISFAFFIIINKL